MDDPKKVQEGETQRQSANLLQTIKDAQTALQELQDNCAHPKEYNRIRDTNPNGSAVLRKTCDLCGLVVGYPTDEELGEWAGIK